ncbi:MAG: helix-turn-helix transcriptional regulator [Lachnospiraceae bacterium]
MDIGKKIAELRKNKAVTQAQLAGYLDVTPQTVSRWEANNGVPDIYLLPRIATFFEVSMEDLFGIRNMEKVHQLVCRYSILRDEKSYEDAMAAIENELHSAGEEHREEDVQTLLADKMHVFIQKSREFLKQAEELADELLELTKEADNPWHGPIRFQKIQFQALNGHGYEVLRWTREKFKKEPCFTTLQYYMLALLETSHEEEILKLKSDAFVEALLQKKDEKASSIWYFLFSAAEKTEDLAFFQTYLPDFATFAQPQDLLYARFSLARIYGIKGMAKEKQDLKQTLYSMAETMEHNELMLHSIEQL